MGYIWRNGISGRLLVEPGYGDRLYPDEADWRRPLASDQAQYREMFHFSTDIAAAWQVVKHIKGCRCEVRIRFCEILFESAEDAPASGIYTFLDITPEAICLAALKAVEAA